jgi:hypothetical protein
MNWPVEVRLGHFHLTDTIDAYLGKPYDAAEEFAWRLQNCHWRNL